jgi:DNA-binding transcriptional regulator YdaS (Cro superfamily)
MLLKTYLEREHLSMHRFAQLAGLHHATIWRHIRLRQMPTPLSCQKIMRATNGQVNQYDLFTASKAVARMEQLRQGRVAD